MNQYLYKEHFVQNYLEAALRLGQRGAVWIRDVPCGTEGVAAVVGMLGVCHSRVGQFLEARAGSD